MKLEATLISSVGQPLSPATQNPRFATEADEDFIVECARKFIAQSPFADLEFDEPLVRSVFQELLIDGCVLVSENGFIAGTITSLFFSPGTRIATELAWYCPGGGGAELREMFEEWAHTQGVQAVQMGMFNNSDAPKMARNLLRAGYVPVEMHYLKAA